MQKFHFLSGYVIAVTTAGNVSAVVSLSSPLLFWHIRIFVCVFIDCNRLQENHPNVSVQ